MHLKDTPVRFTFVSCAVLPIARKEWLELRVLFLRAAAGLCGLRIVHFIVIFVKDLWSGKCLFYAKDFNV